MVVVLVVENSFIEPATRWVVCEGKRSNGIAVERELTSDNISPLRLLRLEEVLRSKSANEHYTRRDKEVSDLAGSFDHSLHGLSA